MAGDVTVDRVVAVVGGKAGKFPKGEGSPNASEEGVGGGMPVLLFSLLAATEPSTDSAADGAVPARLAAREDSASWKEASVWVTPAAESGSCDAEERADSDVAAAGAVTAGMGVGVGVAEG